MGLDLEEDLKRKMIDLNLAAARQFLSRDTLFVHDPDKRDAIPLLENFCYALALLRSRLAENMLEGKERIEKLLPFEVDGNFPRYLHEYPLCKERVHSLEILPVLHYALRDYRPALGDDLAAKLESLICRILSHAYKMHRQRPLSPRAHFRLKRYFEPLDVPAFQPSTPEEWADALITLHMTGGDLPQALVQKWHPELMTYIGPQDHDRQEPQATLLDLFMGHYYGTYSRRALEAKGVHLLASLVHPFLGAKQEANVPEDHAEKGYAVFWGGAEMIFSFALEKACRVERTSRGVELTIPLAGEASQDAYEASFFLSLAPEQRIAVSGQPATTFQLGEEIDLAMTGQRIRMQWEIVNGEGNFFGHILRANRPSQKGKNLKFETYDWQIALRTIRRSSECSLKVLLSFS